MVCGYKPTYFNKVEKACMAVLFLKHFLIEFFGGEARMEGQRDTGRRGLINEEKNKKNKNKPTQI